MLGPPRSTPGTPTSPLPTVFLMVPVDDLLVEVDSSGSNGLNGSMRCLRALTGGCWRFRVNCYRTVSRAHHYSPFLLQSAMPSADISPVHGLEARAAA